MLIPIVATLLWVFDTLIQLYIFVILLAVVASWLVAFGVLNMRNELARSLINFLDALTEPVFRLVRRIVPAIVRTAPDPTPYFSVAAMAASRSFG